MGFLLHDMNEGGTGGVIVQGPTYVPSQQGVTLYLTGGEDITVVLNRY